MNYLRSLLIGIFCLCAALSGLSQTDSLSYAFGYESSLSLLAGENSLFATEADLKEFCRGLDENTLTDSLLNDTCYIRNYSLGVTGAMQTVNRMASSALADWEAYIPHVIEGVKAVAEKRVSLPADTLGLTKRLPAIENAAALGKMSETEKELLFKGYGIYNASRLDLPQLFEVARISGTKPDYPAFFAGFFQALEDINPDNAYGFGRLMAKTQVANIIAWPSFSFGDFVKGAKAAFGQADPLMSREEVENFIDRLFSSQPPAQPNDGKSIQIGGRQYLSGSTIDVDWKFCVYSTAESATCPADVMDAYSKAIGRITERFGIKKMIPLRFNDLMQFFREPPVERAELAKCIASINKKMKKGYKLFFFKSPGGEWTIGLAMKKDAFEADVKTIWLEVYDEQKNIVGLTFRFGNDSEKTREWADFTRNNIGKTVVMEINGEAVMAPIINSEITSGASSITADSIEEIKWLLSL